MAHCICHGWLRGQWEGPQCCSQVRRGRRRPCDAAPALCRRHAGDSGPQLGWGGCVERGHLQSSKRTTCFWFALSTSKRVPSKRTQAHMMGLPPPSVAVWSPVQIVTGIPRFDTWANSDHRGCYRHIVSRNETLLLPLKPSENRLPHFCERPPAQSEVLLRLYAAQGWRDCSHHWHKGEALERAGCGWAMLIAPQVGIQGASALQVYRALEAGAEGGVSSG